jgi:hypothetical protein
VIDSTISGNGSGFQGSRGGGIEAYGPTTITNSTLTSNDAHGGSAIYARDSLVLTNSTVAGNSIFLVGRLNPAAAVVKNSILWHSGLGLGNDSSAEVAHSLIEGGWPGTGNIDADPLFVDPMNGDFRLLPGSPAIDAGDNRYVPMDITTDIRGNPRFINGVVDMGAYEFFQRRKRANVPVTTAPPRVIR